MEAYKAQPDDTADYYGGLNMDKVDELTEELLRALLESEMYREFIRQQSRLKAEPELMERVNHYRMDNFLMQQDMERDHFTLVDQVSQELSELRKIPEVNAYLDSELALCREVQKICRTLIEGIDMVIPDL